MGIRRYLTPENWYSNHVELLLKRKPEGLKETPLRQGHRVERICNNNVADSQRFEPEMYTRIYQKMLSHGDYGFFGYVDGRCACRCWGRVNPQEETYYGQNLHLPADSIYVHYVETAEDSRRQGLAKECLDALVKACGDRVMYVMVDMENAASMRLHKELGFREEAVLFVRKRYMEDKTVIHWIAE